MPAPELRLVLAVSLDGRLAPPAGGAAQIGGEGDRQVLEQALAWADACLIGARTLRLHGTTCLIRDPALQAQRRSAGRSPQPAALVVSRSGQFDPALRFFQQPLRRWLLSPGGSRPVGFDQALALAADWPQTLAALAAAGLERLVLLGGAELAGQLLQLQLVDQLQFTLCPLLLGGTHHWLPADRLDLSAERWQLLEQRPLLGDELLLRYGRIRGSAPVPPLP